MYKRVTRKSWARSCGKFPHLIEYELDTGKKKRDGTPQPNEVAILTSHMHLWPAEVKDLRELTTLHIAQKLCTIVHWREWDQKR